MDFKDSSTDVLGLVAGMLILTTLVVGGVVAFGYLSYRAWDGNGDTHECETYAPARTARK